MGKFVISSDGTNYIPNDTDEKGSASMGIHPPCYVSNEEVYPLCKGNGEKRCHDCCLFEDYDVYNSPFDY